MKEKDSIVVIETVIDDLTPMALGYLLERVLEAGAKDSYIVPCTMKKSRPGHVVTVLVDKKHFNRVADVIFEESTTTGIRFYKAERMKLKCVSRNVKTKHGSVSVKFNSKSRAMPEFESCREVAKKKKIPFVNVYEEAKRRGIHGAFKD